MGVSRSGRLALLVGLLLARGGFVGLARIFLMPTGRRTCWAAYSSGSGSRAAAAWWHSAVSDRPTGAGGPGGPRGETLRRAGGRRRQLRRRPRAGAHRSHRGTRRLPGHHRPQRLREDHALARDAGTRRARPGHGAAVRPRAGDLPPVGPAGLRAPARDAGPGSARDRARGRGHRPRGRPRSRGPGRLSGAWAHRRSAGSAWACRDTPPHASARSPSASSSAC